MIKINLLPEELRRKETPKLSKVFYAIIIISVLGFLIIFHTIININIRSSRQGKVEFTQRLTELAPIKKDVDIIKQEIAVLNQKIESIDRLVGRRILWALKLNQLSDLIVPGIWLTELSLTHALPPRGLPISLNLEGSVISQHGEEMAIVGKFIANLKNNESFSENFADIELKSIQRRKIKDTEVMDFVLICYFYIQELENYQGNAEK